MGLGNRMRALPVSREVLDRHNRHAFLTWGDLAPERQRERARQEATDAAMEGKRRPREEEAA